MALFLLSGSCEAFSLPSAPRAGALVTRAGSGAIMQDTSDFRFGSAQITVGCGGGTEAGLYAKDVALTKNTMANEADAFRQGYSQMVVGCAGGTEAGVYGTSEAGVVRSTMANDADVWRQGYTQMVVGCAGGTEAGTYEKYYGTVAPVRNAAARWAARDAAAAAAAQQVAPVDPSVVPGPVPQFQ